jgi:hypothetical protein
MSSQPDWKKCEDCCKATLSYDSNEVDRISQENQLSCGSQMRELQGTINLSTLCDKCIIITPCSVCKKIISTPHKYTGGTIRMEISNFNEEPICTECKNIQCYRCGEEGYIKTWHDWIMCEECGMALCNNCDGECDHPCQKCERPCDNCSCSEDIDDEEE